MSEDKQPAEDPPDRWLKEAEQWRMTLGVSPSYTGGRAIYSPLDASWVMVDTPVKPSAGRTPADEAPAGTMADETQAVPEGIGITGLSLWEEERIKSLWPKFSLTYTDMSNTIYGHEANAERIRKAGYKLQLGKRKVGRKQGP